MSRDDNFPFESFDTDDEELFDIEGIDIAPEGDDSHGEGDIDEFLSAGENNSTDDDTYDQEDDFSDLSSADYRSDNGELEEQLLGENVKPHGELSNHNDSDTHHADKEYIDGLIAVAEGIDDSDDLDDAFENQRITNMHFDAVNDAPNDISLIGEPDTNADHRLPQGRSGDEKTLTFLQGIGIACTTAVVMIIIFAAALMLKPEPEPIAQPPESSQPSGDIISEAINGGGNRDSNSGSEGNSERREETGESSEDDGDIRYELVSEGGVKTVSVSYINGAGSKESETGVTLPWSKSISSGDSITPHFAANPGERGTLTCKIYRGGEKIAEDTASGENASVECRADE